MESSVAYQSIILSERPEFKGNFEGTTSACSAEVWRTNGVHFSRVLTGGRWANRYGSLRIALVWQCPQRLTHSPTR